MKFVKPKVYLIAQTEINYRQINEYLETLESNEWLDNRGNNSDLDSLPEFAGRLCYASFRLGLNPNVTKIRTDSKAYIANMLNQKHGSVLEHASMTFLFQNVSRVFTHELVRHRAGCAISQESLRYVRLDNINFVDPFVLLDTKISEDNQVCVAQYIEACENFQQFLISQYIRSNTKFSEKKKLTSWFRRFAPIGLATSILWTANIRALRHIIPIRTTVHAEAEIRLVMGEVAKICKEEAPLCFTDMTVNEAGEWIVEYEKV